MHFRLPKPLHGWRALFGEVGIIVVGVLIALGAQQLAQAIQDRARMRESEAALALELGEAVGQAVVKIRELPCIEGHLDTLAGIVDGAAKSGQLPPVGELNIPETYTWPSGAWQSIQNGEVAAMEPRDRLQGLSVAYELISFLTMERRQDIEAWTGLFELVGPGLPFSAEDAARARGMISQARIVDRSIVVHSRRLLERSAEAGIRVDRASVELYSGPSHSIANADACPPTFGPVPAHYGNAPFRLKAIEARQMNIGR